MHLESGDHTISFAGSRRRLPMTVTSLHPAPRLSLKPGRHAERLDLFAPGVPQGVPQRFSFLVITFTANQRALVSRSDIEPMNSHGRFQTLLPRELAFLGLLHTILHHGPTSLNGDSLA